MEFNLRAQFQHYTEPALKEIVDNPESYTLEARAAAATLLNERFPGWNVVWAPAADAVMQAEPVTDLLDDLEEVAPQDPVAKRIFRFGMVYLASLMAFSVYFSSSMVIAALGGVPGRSLTVVVVVLLVSLSMIGGLTVLWYRKTPLGWNLVYIWMLLQVACCAKPYGEFVGFAWSNYDYAPPGQLMFLAVVTIILMMMLFLLCAAARRRVAALFRVTDQNRLFTVLIGWGLLLAYEALINGVF